MRCVAASGDVTGGTNVVIISVIGGTTVVVEPEMIIFGSSGTPADAVAKFAIREPTDAGTSSGTPDKYNMDRNGQAPQATLKKTYSVNPTFTTGNLFEINVNQRATFPWTVPPGLRSKLSANYGFSVVMISGPAVAWNVTIIWAE